MTDLEMTKLCAEAMGFTHFAEGAIDYFMAWKEPDKRSLAHRYAPLHDDAQAMALVKKCGLEIHCRMDGNGWYVGYFDGDHMVPHADLNRAIVECVAKMQQSKEKP